MRRFGIGFGLFILGYSIIGLKKSFSAELTTFFQILLLRNMIVVCQRYFDTMIMRPLFTRILNNFKQPKKLHSYQAFKIRA